jgi:predicted enzyme related to lactoylglutathione lyase
VIAIGAIVIRVRDLDAQMTFWTRALDYIPREPASSDFVVLRSRGGEGPNLSLDRQPSERVLPPRIHLDLYTDDQTGEVRRLTALGAREVVWDGRPDDADYVIMQDPEGNRFCVVDHRPA